MLRWMTPLQQQHHHRNQELNRLDYGQDQRTRINRRTRITDDPLAAIEPDGDRPKNIYAVSRINPLFSEQQQNQNRQMFVKEVDGSRRIEKIPSSSSSSPSPADTTSIHVRPTVFCAKSTSSGYCGSSQEPIYYAETNEPKATNRTKKTVPLGPRRRTSGAQDYNSGESVDRKRKKRRKRTKKPTESNVDDRQPSTYHELLATIHEGRIDWTTVPRPVWPLLLRRSPKNVVEDDSSSIDSSLFDERVSQQQQQNDEEGLEEDVPSTKQTTASFYQDDRQQTEQPLNLAKVNDEDALKRHLLLDLLRDVRDAIDGRSTWSRDELLRRVAVVGLTMIAQKNDEAHADDGIDGIENAIRRLSANIANDTAVRCVTRAFHRSEERQYDVGDRSAIDGNNNNDGANEKKCVGDFVTGCNGSCCDLNEVDGVRIGAIRGDVDRVDVDCGTSCSSSGLDQEQEMLTKTKKIGELLRATPDCKPSVWQLYYGARATSARDGDGHVPKPTDVPLYPGGRPEADFTLDMPRSELLRKKLIDDKRWRCRCRLFTTFICLVFFLVSVMGVSLLLTRGKRMFGSMV